MLNSMELDKIEQRKEELNMYLDEYNICDGLLDLNTDGIYNINEKVRNFCVNELKFDAEKSYALIGNIQRAVKEVIQNKLDEDGEKLREFF